MKKGIIKEHILKLKSTPAGHDRVKELIEALIKAEIVRPAYRDIEYYAKTYATKNPYNTSYGKTKTTDGLRYEGGEK